MNEKIAAEVFSRLDAIAAKLGIAANHLWPILVRQQSNYGWTVILTSVFVLGLSVLIFLSALRWLKEDSDMQEFICMSMFVVFGVGFCASVIMVPDAILHILNPEYYAFMDLMGR